jgi:hypothetical protein
VIFIINQQFTGIIEGRPRYPFWLALFVFLRTQIFHPKELFPSRIRFKDLRAIFPFHSIGLSNVQLTLLSQVHPRIELNSAIHSILEVFDFQSHSF